MRRHMTQCLVEVISPVPAPTEHTVMMEDPREEEDLDVVEVVLPMVVMMLVVIQHMIKRLPKESRTTTTLVLVKTIIRPCPMELPLSTLPEITVKVTTKVRLTTKLEHLEATSHQERIFFLPFCLSAWLSCFVHFETLGKGRS